MIDHEGRARLTILAPAWAARRKDADDIPVMIQTEAMAEFDAPTVNRFSFGVVALEVRPLYLAAYSII